MRPGGKRRAIIPPSLAYGEGSLKEPQPPSFAMQRQLLNHSREPLMFELQLLAVKPERFSN